jgi:hypothetical protein
VVIELGGNDALRGLPVAMTRDNLDAMTKAVKAAGAKAMLIGMQMPPNYGARYAQDFAAVFASVAKQDGAALVPFLRGVADAQVDAWFQPDRIHGQGHPLILDNVWAVPSPGCRRSLGQGTTGDSAFGRAPGRSRCCEGCSGALRPSPRARPADGLARLASVRGTGGFAGRRPLAAPAPVKAKAVPAAQPRQVTAQVVARMAAGCGNAGERLGLRCGWACSRPVSAASMRAGRPHGLTRWRRDWRRGAGAARIVPRIGPALFPRWFGRSVWRSSGRAFRRSIGRLFDARSGV